MKPVVARKWVSLVLLEEKKNCKGVACVGGLSLSQTSSSLYTSQPNPGYLAPCPCHIPFFCLKSIYIWLVLLSWDIVFFLAWKGRWLGNTFKSKPICLISLPLLLFSCSAARRKLQYVLILRSFQEKYIPEHCFHVCHIMAEKVSPCWQAASSPSQTTWPRAPLHGRGNSLHMPPTHIAQREYIHTTWPVDCVF